MKDPWSFNNYIQEVTPQPNSWKPACHAVLPVSRLSLPTDSTTHFYINILGKYSTFKICINKIVVRFTKPRSPFVLPGRKS